MHHFAPLHAIFPTLCKPSHPFTNLYIPSQTFTSILKHLLSFANLHTPSQTFAPHHKASHSFMNLHESLHPFTNRHTQPQIFTPLCKPSHLSHKTSQHFSNLCTVLTNLHEPLHYLGVTSQCQIILKIWHSSTFI